MAEPTADRGRAEQRVDDRVDERADGPGALPDGDPASVQRRAPFATNPRVGARGLRAQQRILDAALQAFAETGYQRCGVDRITRAAGCSRAAFYQYFSSKEDVFRHLAGLVARRLAASAEALGPVTAGEDGWRTLHAWAQRYAETQERYEPVFREFEAAAESDELVASGAARVGERHAALLQAKLPDGLMPTRALAGTLQVLTTMTTRSLWVATMQRRAAPASALPVDRLVTAVTDVTHRTLFGLDPAVNVRPPPPGRPARPPGSAALLRSMREEATPRELTSAGTRTLDLLLASAHDLLVSQGYHGTRVDDITSAAELSHGAFYRYFANKDEVVRVLSLRALNEVSTAFDDVPSLAERPGPAGAAALRRWLRNYAATYAPHAAIIRVWVDATADDADLRLQSAAALDWGRRRLVRALAPRGFGDVEADALLMLALLDVVGASIPQGSPGPQGPAVEATALVVERGILGQGPGRAP